MNKWIHYEISKPEMKELFHFTEVCFYESKGQYRKTSNIRHTLVGNKIVDHSDVVGASPVGAAPTISSFST